MSLSFPRRGLLGARCTDKKRCLVCVKTTRLANSGVMVVAAAGNYGRNVMGCPAVAENTLSVGATVRFPESSWHRFLMRRFTGLYYKLEPENYGTSVACARLSGTLALIRSAIPDLTYAEFTDAVNRAAMLSCADDVTLAGGPGVVGELHGYRTFKLIEHLRAGGPLDLEKAREHWERGRKHFESGRYEQAAREFETATELVPTSHIAFHDLALACHRLGRPRIAEDFLNEAIRLHWAVAAAHNDLGTIFQAGGQLEVALEHYRMALFIEPGLEAAAMNESAVAGALQSRRAGLDRLAKAGAIVLDGPFIQNEQ